MNVWRLFCYKLLLVKSFLFFEGALSCYLLEHSPRLHYRLRLARGDRVALG